MKLVTCAQQYKAVRALLAFMGRVTRPPFIVGRGYWMPGAGILRLEEVIDDDCLRMSTIFGFNVWVLSKSITREATVEDFLDYIKQPQEKRI